MSGLKKNTVLKQLTKKDLKHLEVFVKHRHFHDFFHSTGELVGFHHHIQQELLMAYRVNFDPYYTYNSSCVVCVVEFLNNCYSHYDKR